MQILKKNIKEKIVHSAISQIIKKGDKETSMQDIASEAEISVGNLYRYFKNKESLIEYILEPVEMEINVFLNTVSIDSIKHNKETILHDMINQFVNMCECHEERFNIFFNRANYEAANHFKERLLHIVIERMNVWIPLKSHLETEEVVRHAVALSLIEGIGVIVNKYYRAPKALRETLNAYSEVMLRGLEKQILEG